MRALAIAVLGVLIVGCAAPPTPSPTSSILALPPPTFAPTAPNPSPALLTEMVGEITFTRPAGWYEERPTVHLDPGSFLWLSSVPLTSPGSTLPPDLPTGFIPAGVLPDGGVLMTFYTGAGTYLPLPSPMAVVAIADATCTRAAGHAVRARIEGSYLEACLNGQAADASFQTFFDSLRVGPTSTVPTSPSPPVSKAIATTCSGLPQPGATDPAVSRLPDCTEAKSAVLAAVARLGYPVRTITIRSPDLSCGGPFASGTYYCPMIPADARRGSDYVTFLGTTKVAALTFKVAGIGPVSAILAGFETPPAGWSMP